MQPRRRIIFISFVVVSFLFLVIKTQRGSTTTVVSEIITEKKRATTDLLPCYHLCHRFEYVPCGIPCPVHPISARGANYVSVETLAACPNPYRDALTSPFTFYTLKGGEGGGASILGVACYARTDIVCDHIGLTGTWEPNLLAVLTQINEKVLAKFHRLPTYVDIGANVGVFVWVMGRRGNPVIAFEMMPSNLALLYYTLCLNPAHLDPSRMTFYHAGVSDRDGACAMISQSTNEGDGVLICNETRVQYFVSKERYIIRGRVALRTLDTVFASAKGSHLPFPSIVKVDVEGHEPYVVRGGSRVLRGRMRPLVILSEVWGSIDIPAYARLMREEYEYDVWWVDKGKELVTHRDVVEMHKQVGAHPNNLLFVRRDYREELNPF